MNHERDEKIEVDRAAGSADLSRREFLAKSGAAGAGLALSGALLSAYPDSASAQGKAPEKASEKVPTAILGRTGRRVSKLGFGGSWDIESSVLQAGVEKGVNYFDTAEKYQSGNSERAMGAFIRENCKRKEIYVVTKTFAHHDLETHLEGSLKRLGLDYVDTLYLHSVDTPGVLSDVSVKEAAERLKKAGKIRFFGFSTHSSRLTECMEAGAKSGWFDVVMFKYNFRLRDSDAQNRAIDACVAAKMGLVAMKTLSEGTNIPAKFDVFKQQGMSKVQAALRAIWADERIHSLVSEMVNHEQIVQNTAAATQPLTKAEADTLRRYAALTDHLYCRGCEQHCQAGAGRAIAVADILRFQMYHDHYKKPERARELFAELTPVQRDLSTLTTADWQRAEAACPHSVPLRQLMEEATRNLA